MSQPDHVSTEADIRDPDLLAELEEARGTPEFADMVRYLATKQRYRDAGQGTPAATAKIDDPDIRDADLRERLAKVPGDQFGRMMREGLVREQKARDEKTPDLPASPPLPGDARRCARSSPSRSIARTATTSTACSPSAVCPTRSRRKGRGTMCGNTAAAPLWCRPDT